MGISHDCGEELRVFAPEPVIEDYTRLQYKALRTEIDYLTKVLMQFQGISVSAIPLIVGTGEKYDLDFVVLAGPIITVVFALMLLFIQDSIMRAGEYIRTTVEPRLRAEGETGWEQWLEHQPKNRTAEAFFAWSAHIAFSLYYLGSSYLAHGRLATRFGAGVANGAIGFYLGLFAICLFLLIKNLRTNTKGVNEE